MNLTSAAFKNGGTVPKQYTCDGAGFNPPLSISGVPEGTQSLALIVDDPDVPKRLKPDGVFDHWVLFNILPGVTEISENAAPGAMPGVRGVNGRGALGYVPPCPPPHYDPSEHRYVFTLYALDEELDLSEGATKEHVLEAIRGRAAEHIIEAAQLIGTYRRQ